MSLLEVPHVDVVEEILAIQLAPVVIRADELWRVDRTGKIPAISRTAEMLGRYERLGSCI